MPKKYPSDFNTRTLRIKTEDAELVISMARELKMTPAAFFHIVLTMSGVKNNGNKAGAEPA